MQAIKKWFSRYLSDPEALIILATIVFAFLVFKLVGNIMVPIIASLVIAYLLEGCINRLINWRMPRLLAVILVFLIFIDGLCYPKPGALNTYYRINYSNLFY